LLSVFFWGIRQASQKADWQARYRVARVGSGVGRCQASSWRIRSTPSARRACALV
jgi:hypothetical protein